MNYDIDQVGSLEFYTRVTKAFKVTVEVDGNNPDITSDKLVFTIRDRPGTGDIIFTKNADVQTSGSSGVGIFYFTQTNLNIDEGEYFYDVIWSQSSGDEYPIQYGKIDFSERVS